MLPRNTFDLSKITDWRAPAWKRHEYIHTLTKSMGFTFLGEGRHRMTFLAPHKRFVLKFPKNRYGLLDNQAEDGIWSRYLGKPNANGVQHAPCRLIQNSVLMMRTVFNISGDTLGCECGRKILGGMVYANLPTWSEEIECEQIGKLPGGKIVAYDYAE